MCLCECSRRACCLAALLMLAAVQLSYADCPKPCVCHVSTEAHCTFRYLSAVPAHFPPAVERVNLGYNGLTYLRETDFLGIEKLQLLMLHSNSIHTIEDNTFTNLSSLQVLKMSHNNLKEINKKTFKGLESLLRLHIDHNQIGFINPEALCGLTKLQLINLDGNQLQQLHADTFITLRHSQVFKVSSVRIIHLSNNLLTTLPADIFLGCSQLENLLLHGNPWACDCRMKGFLTWMQRNHGVLKCSREKSPRGQLCPICETPAQHQHEPLTLLQSDEFICAKPCIKSDLKQKNISLYEGDFTPVSPKDFIAPLGSIEITFAGQYNDASLSCTVQRPSAFENLRQSISQDKQNNTIMVATGITSYLVCNIDQELSQLLWTILATYSDFPLRLVRSSMVTNIPEMVYRYSQVNNEDEGITTNIEAEVKGTPTWLMQREISLQLDRTTSTFSTLHIKYQSVVNLHFESMPSKKDRYSWTLIKRDNYTKTEHTLITGGVVKLNCQIQGEPKPLVEWILPDGSKVRAPFSSEDRRITISPEGMLTLRGAHSSDTGLYWCISTNYLDADILKFRVTILSPDVQESEKNGVQVLRTIGENLKFDCRFSGNPKVFVSWILPDHTVLEMTHGNKIIFKNGTLFIQGLTVRDQGYYRCLVSNHLGIDLLVHEVTLTEERFEATTALESEGSGMVVEVNLNSKLTRNKSKLSEITPSFPFGSMSQESRMITSDRPYPRLRSQGRGSFKGRLGQRRRGPFPYRNNWNGRVFDKVSRKVDPKKFAEFLKKAQGVSRLKTNTTEEKVDLQNISTIGNDEIGSGEDYRTDNLIVPAWTLKPTKEAFISTQKNENDVFITRQKNNAGHTFYFVDKMEETSNTLSTEMYKETHSTPNEHLFPYLQHPVQTTEFYQLEQTREPVQNVNPVTLQLSSKDTAQLTGVSYSEERVGETETSTETTLPLATDPNVFPVRADPVELVIHSDKDSQTTFTAITTTEKHQDQITFHTTQTIKSPHISGQSTIISQQQFHIIPGKLSRGKGQRRTFHGRKRIIKPNRITDVQSFINRFKRPIVKKEESSSVLLKTEQTTECDCDENRTKPETTDVQVITPTVLTRSLSKTERPASSVNPVSNPYSSSNAPIDSPVSRSHGSTKYGLPPETPEVDQIIDYFLTAKTTTSPSKIIRRKIPWNRLLGPENEKIQISSKKPTVQTRPSNEPKSTLVTTTPASLSTTRPDSQDILESLSPFKGIKGKDSSLDQDYSGLASVDTEFTRSHHLTTTDLSGASRLSSTLDTSSEVPNLPAPPIVNQYLDENPNNHIASGSGADSDQVVVLRQKFTGRRRHQRKRKRPLGGRRNFKRPGYSTIIPKTTVAPNLESKPPRSTIDELEPSQHNILFYNAMYMRSNGNERTTGPNTISQTLAGLYRDSTSGNLSSQTPFPSSSINIPTTTLVPLNRGQPFKTFQNIVYSFDASQKENDNIITKHMTTFTRPTVESSSVDEEHIFDRMTVYTSEENHDKHSRNSEINKSTSSTYISFIGMKGTIARDSKPESQTSKPRIVGGNAASLTVLSNSDAFLPCVAVGNPRPVLTWKYVSPSTGNTITIMEQMGKFDVLSNGTLTIHKANIRDHGQYICLAENDYGSDKLTVTLSVVAYPSRILEPKMREIKSQTGKRAEMKCKTEGRPMPMISWILANQTQVRGENTGKGRVSVSPEGTLIIEHVSISDRGYYKCIASNPFGADTATVRLQVVAAPPGIVEEKRQQLKATLGQNMWLPCTGYGIPHPTVYWVVQDGSVVQSNRHISGKRKSMHENGTLLIKDITPADSGKYECIATSSTGSERRVVTLSVKRQESVSQQTSKDKTELSYGDQLRLHCVASGDPKQRVLWRLPSKAVVDHRHRLGNRIQVLDNGTLIVDTVNDKDEGDYLCMAKSPVGEDLQLTRVTVSMKPAKIESKFNRKTQVHYGKDFKVDCKATGAPKPEISWGLPDGTVLNRALQADSSHGEEPQRFTLFDNGTLYLNQVGLSEEGDYICYAENQLGKDQMHVHIAVVTSPPRINLPSQTYARVKPGGNIRFDCEAYGEPKPKILWRLSNNDVIAASNERYLVHVNGSLDIRDVTVNDAGEYVCMARNPGGETRKVYKLDMDGIPPIINGYRQNRTVIKDVVLKHSRIFIDCKADGDPSPIITWIMPDNIFLKAPYFGSRINVHHNGTLEIRNVRPSDTAEFICLARNDGGEAVMVVQLEVATSLQRPIFKNPFNEHQVSQLGKTTVLNCSADGYPIPEIIWTLPNGTKISHLLIHGPRHYPGRNGALIIYNSHQEDSGKYRCGAKNSLGFIEKLIILSIGTKPYILTRPKGIIRSMIGQPLFLHCLSDGSPRPNIYWTVPGGHTLTRPQTLGRYKLLENGTLVVHDATLLDRGNYVCRAHNNAGHARLTVPVSIISFPPKITYAPPRRIRAATGTPIRLNCAASGIPKPDISWELPDHLVPSTPEQGWPIGDEQGTLIIERLSAADSGQYKCLAKNDLGTDSKLTFVLVI